LHDDKKANVSLVWLETLGKASEFFIRGKASQGGRLKQKKVLAFCLSLLPS
jgi:hypothetical protein